MKRTFSSRFLHPLRRDTALEPLRGELFNLDQLAGHAQAFAKNHRIAPELPRTLRQDLLKRLDENEDILREYNDSARLLTDARRLTPAAEWMLDNFYLVEEQIQMARRHLPKGYSRRLPVSENGWPRVYDLVLDFISHVDARVDAESLSVYTREYQTVSPLQIGELWAVPIMLRLGLIENLRRIAFRLTRMAEDQELAEYWISRLKATAEKQPSDLVLEMAAMSRAQIPLTHSFVAGFCQGINRQGPLLLWTAQWFEHYVAERGLAIEQLSYNESETQAGEQISVSHSIASLRFLAAMDWREFVENMSHVDHVLRADPGDVYSDMDFASRDSYRHHVEEIARRSRRGLSEIEVAQEVVALASRAVEASGREERSAHIGYYLAGKGRDELDRLLEVSLGWEGLADTLLRRSPRLYYFGGLSVLSLAGTSSLLLAAHLCGVEGIGLGLVGLLGLIASSQWALALVNGVVSLGVKPRLLPKLNYLTAGIAKDRRTLVVVPCLLSGAKEIDRLIETLEIDYLGNQDPLLFFALLTDYADAPAETLPKDRALLERAIAGIRTLNEKYAEDRAEIFSLFHRPRRWNGKEKVWMGHERKRGKLNDFNRFLRGGDLSAFEEVVGDPGVLHGIRYVITLDSDTVLPRDTARQMVAAMAHPLNRPRLGSSGIVEEGYGILQPRIAISLPSADRSPYVKLFAGDVGIDPYTRVVSDTYQDLFQEGSFIGKGIYDVDAFIHASEGRFPENRILSHDLIESCHVRSGLLSDVTFYEDHPSHYLADARRRHRWMRGDWQIAQWIFSKVPGEREKSRENPLSFLSRWKILDNLRRSLVPPCLVALVMVSWLAFPSCTPWAYGVLAVVLWTPGLFALLLETFRKPKELPVWMHVRATAQSAGRQLGQMAASLILLPYDAWLCLDAVVRTLFRLAVSRRRLLEWTTSRDAERRAKSDHFGFWSSMAVVPATAVVATALLLFNPAPLSFLPFPLLILWFASPTFAWYLSRPFPREKQELAAHELRYLRRVARKTWRFFEHFITSQENALPPDNYQEHPTAVVASRTSPTNIGLALLSNLAARDLGYLSVGELIRRTRSTLDTLFRMERYRGHFYNWYDTRTLRPLPPHYVSSVDSGNLAGHLLVLESGLDELPTQPLLSPVVYDGLLDTCELLTEASEEAEAWGDFKADLERGFTGVHSARLVLERLRNRLRDPGLTPVPASYFAGNPEATAWRQALEFQISQHLDEVNLFMPWLAGPEPRGLLPLDGAIATAWAALMKNPSLSDLALLRQNFCPLLEDGLAAHAEKLSPQERQQAGLLKRQMEEASDRAAQRIEELQVLAQQAHEFASMDFTFLYDKTRDLFSIGYNVSECKRDASYYDLLASEARLCSYVAVAQGQVEQEHWFSLGRLLLSTGGGPVLASWSGSMFEYLMPLLVMPTYKHTLLDQTYKRAVAAQIEHGRSHGIPWGVSESGYNRTDIHLNYQYRAFGVPSLGLKRGLSEDLVIAPYATVMSLMVAPRAAYENLCTLREDGREGAYGFYEAIDYTPTRIPPGQTHATVRSFMVHHQGMSFLALTHLLADRPMQRRFMACPALKATSLLLQERVPKTSANVFPSEIHLGEAQRVVADNETILRIFPTALLASPEVNLISNGDYHVVMTTSGGGYSRWKELAVTRWREDATRDAWGSYIYIRDMDSGKSWSATYQPTVRPGHDTEVIFSEGRIEYRQEHDELEMHVEVSVSPEDDVELRRLSVTNRADYTRTLEFTSYAEVVLAPQTADTAHPAFSNLFVQTEYLADTDALLCTRRARTREERPPFLVHLLVPEGNSGKAFSYETDRLQFTGRGRSPANPLAMEISNPLSNTTGAVLDPIVSIRRVLEIRPHATVRIDYVMGMAEEREEALALAGKYSNFRMGDRVLEMAWTHAQLRLRQLNIPETDAQLYARLAGKVIYADRTMRAPASALLANRRNQSSLWGHGISGDLPIVLLSLRDTSKIEWLRRMLQAHAYWRNRGLQTDLVILNEDESSYRQPLQEAILELIHTGTEAALLDKPGGVFVRHTDQMQNEDRLLLQAAARLVLSGENGTLEEQLNRLAARETTVPWLQPMEKARYETSDVPGRDLIFHNGLGGFTPDGREYVTTLHKGQTTPAPWSNVLANPYFGTVLTETGSAYTWVENCHEFRLTPWNNDPISDSGGEAFYIRDERTGQFWSPTPLPARGDSPYVIRHGFGYSVYEHTENGICSELWVYVAIDAPVKFMRLKVRNVSGRPRRLSLTGYWEWVLGEHRHKTLLHVQTQIDPKSGALMARNAHSMEFADRVVFLDVNGPSPTFTGDRREFIGRHGTLAAPAALKRIQLSGKVGAGLDPCGAAQVIFDLTAGEERTTTFKLGVGRDASDAQTLLQRFRRPNAGHAALEQVWDYWNRTLGAVTVETPDPSVNVLANGWLLYQTLSCRMWARTGYYQSGGAFGFRDQLQDAMALVHAEPILLREHLLRAAAQQFREGDVQHWWHPPAGRGVRTHFSDDYLWLPYATCRYVDTLADTGVLDELVPFLEGRPLRPEEESNYDLPARSGESGTLYMHCVRAIGYGLRFGEHGLPLIGCGDWNDGMNKVGEHGKGESVWLAFFLHDVLTRFAKMATLHNDDAFAEDCLRHAEQLQKNIEAHAWDGAWYRRAYFDNGEPLGSQSNPECQIDALPQSWAVLSGVGNPERARQAMQAVDERLVRPEAGLIQLFDPPFDTSELDPGYIKGYVPGVRENGGQYTHAAIWTVTAFAEMGNWQRAWELFHMLNPVHHGDSAERIAVYKVEPYTAAADVYGVAPHTGRGGWTWYTGSAGWMYRLIVETLLGIQLEGAQLKLTPKPPQAWDNFKARYRHRETNYRILIVKDAGKSISETRLDGKLLPSNLVPLTDDRQEHQVEVRMAW